MSIEAMKQALEALEAAPTSWRAPEAQAALRQAIEQAEKQEHHAKDCALLQIPSRDCNCSQNQEPVAWMWEQRANKSSSGIGGWDKLILFCKPPHDPFVEKKNLTPLYTTPQLQREWVGLTDEEIWSACDGVDGSVPSYARAIEAKLKEKNT